jgi:hypothetical protein
VRQSKVSHSARRANSGCHPITPRQFSLRIWAAVARIKAVFLPPE